MTGLYTDWRGRRGTCLWEVSVLLWFEENKFTGFSCFLSLEIMSCLFASDTSDFFLANSPFWYSHIFSCAQEPTWHIGEVTEEGAQKGKVVPKIWNTVCGAMEMSRVRILNPPPSSAAGSMAAVLCCWSCLFQKSQVTQLSHAQCQCNYNLFASKQV